jgi:hypothetical protein
MVEKKTREYKEKPATSQRKCMKKKKEGPRDPNILVPGVFRLRSKRQLYIAYVTGVLRCHNVRECTYTGRCNRIAIFQAVKGKFDLCRWRYKVFLTLQRNFAKKNCNKKSSREIRGGAAGLGLSCVVGIHVCRVGQVGQYTSSGMHKHNWGSNPIVGSQNTLKLILKVFIYNKYIILNSITATG